MHKSSMKNMKKFRNSFTIDNLNLKVLDVGSRDLNGSYKELFGKGYNYVGFDIVPGKNVNITNWEEIKDNSFDIVISGQAFEHIKHDLKVMEEIARVLKPNSYCCIIAPSIGPIHCKPDYRRYKTKDLRLLAEQVGLKIIKIEIDHFSEEWKDCVLIAQKDK